MVKIQVEQDPYPQGPYKILGSREETKRTYKTLAELMASQLGGAEASTESVPADSDGADNAGCINCAHLFFLAKKCLANTRFVKKIS